MSLLFVQHGETAASAKKRLAGFHEPLLDPDGYESAKKSGQLVLDYLGERALHGILTSPAPRAVQTAATISGMFSDAPIFTEERLRPRHIPTTYDNTPAGDLPWRDEAALIALGIEPETSVFARTESCVVATARTLNVLYVGHSSSMPALARIALPRIDLTTMERGAPMIIRP